MTLTLMMGDPDQQSAAWDTHAAAKRAFMADPTEAGRQACLITYRAFARSCWPGPEHIKTRTSTERTLDTAMQHALRKVQHRTANGLTHISAHISAHITNIADFRPAHHKGGRP